MAQLKFSITLDEANKIFKALGKEPFNEVYELIGKLNEQANEQLSKESFKVTRNNLQKEETDLSKKNKKAL
jgi:hypothetical protein